MDGLWQWILCAHMIFPSVRRPRQERAVLVSEVPAFREYWYPVAYGHEIGPEPYPFR